MGGEPSSVPGADGMVDRPEPAPVAPADEHLAETRLDTTVVHDGHLVKLRRDRVRLPDGREAGREFIVHPGAVMVVPLTDDGRVVVERQYRYPVGRILTEFPAGKIDPGEAPFDCARRELREETGYSAQEWACAGRLHNAPAYATEFIEIWFARGLQAGPQSLDAGEHLEVLAVTPDSLLDAAGRGELTDAKTLIALLWLQNWQAGRWTLDWRRV